MAPRNSTLHSLIPAVAYYRMSDDKQEASIPEQREAVERYAADNGYRIIREYIDEGISGDATEHRLEFQRMHHDACNGRDFEAILVWDIDRFGRFDSIDMGKWVAPLRRAGVKLVTVVDGSIDWNDYCGRLMYSIRQEGKHQYLRDLSRNVSRGLIANAKNGYSCGQAAPYGMDRMVIDKACFQQGRTRKSSRRMIMMRQLVLVVVFGWSWVASAQFDGNRTHAEDPYRTDVFVSGKEGYHTFRIPSLVVTKQGTLLAFCEGRKTSRSDHGDLDLVLKRSSNGGETWSGLQVVYDEGGNEKITIGNPCPVIDDATGTIWLTLCRDNDDVLVTHSKDDGESWARPVDITADVKKSNWGWVATGPGVGIQLKRGNHKGRLVIPCDHGEQIDGSRVMFSHVFYSDDRGKSWKLGGSLDRHTDECQVVELTDGSLMLNMRNYWGRAGGRPERGSKRSIATSKDGGDTWSELSFDDTLIEPICQASFLRYSGKDSGDRHLLLFSNPASKNTRHRITVRLSYNEGKSWPVSRLLHEGPSAYSCLTVLPDKSIGCLYEGGEKGAYEKIILARFDLAWLVGKNE